MSGFKNVGSGRTYVKVRDGMFLIGNAQGEVKYTDNRGVDHFYDAYNQVIASFKEIRRETGKFGEQWQFDFVDEDGEPFTISMLYGSIQAQGFINALASMTNPNNLTLRTWQPRDSNGFDRTTIYITEQGQKESLRWKYEIKDQPPTPDLLDAKGRVVLKQNGKPQKDDEERLKFFDAIVARINTEHGSVSAGAAKQTTDSKAVPF